MPLGMYLDCLCCRFQNLSSSDGPTGSKSPDVLYVFKMVLRSVKNSYERRVESIKPDFFVYETGSAVGISRDHCPMLDPSLNGYFESEERAYGTPYGSNGRGSSHASQTPRYHDLWATMTCSWAKEIS